MKLTSIIKEIGDDSSPNAPRQSSNIVLTAKTTPTSELEDALDDLDNYGEYASYAQLNNTDFKKIKDTWFGPAGGPNVKTAAAKKTWNSSDKKWKELKAKDIKTRLPDADITDWGDYTFDELPKEVRNFKIFYGVSTKDAIDNIVKKFTSKPNILDWYEDNGVLVFPRENNETIPNDITLEKVLKTVMKNAGITDARVNKRTNDQDGGQEMKAVSKFTQIKIPVEKREDIQSLRSDLQKQFQLPAASYRIKEEGGKFYLSINNITIQQKANITHYLKSKNLLEEFIPKGIGYDFEHLQRLAGIIK